MAAALGAIGSIVGAIAPLLAGGQRNNAPAPPPPPTEPDVKEPEGTLDAEAARARALSRRREDQTTTSVTSLLGEEDVKTPTQKKKLTGE